jgi:hypothetical protein
VSGITEAETTNQTGEVNETLTNTTTNAIDVTYTFKLTTTTNGCENTQYVTVKVNPKPDAGTINGATEVCINSTIPLTSTGPSGGVWRSEDMSIATVVSDGTVTGVSTGVVKIWYVVTDANGCSDSVSITITVTDELDYPDIRLRLCSSVGTVNLSKYLDTVGVQSVSWSGISILPNGELDAYGLHSPGTYTFKYTVTAGCLNTTKVRKVYVKMLGAGESPHFRDTVKICYKQAQTVNINQLFGLESGGMLSPEPAVAPYVTQTSHGGTIFDGKAFYEATPTKVPYHGADVVMVTFTYMPAGCLTGKTYKLVIVLTDKL